MFKKYRRKGFSEARPYVEDEDMRSISITEEDIKAGSPKLGDMIARNPTNHNDKWLVAEATWKRSYEEKPMEE